MKALIYAGSRLLGFGALAGVSALNIHNLVGIVTSVLTALYTVFITIEAGLRLYERWKLKHASPRVKGSDA